MTLRVLYHVARADFLERVRGYRFLIVLGLAIAAAFLFVPSVDAPYVATDLNGYRGVFDSAWIGALVGLMSSLYLALVGFYAIKGSISRDVDTGVGQIIASTPISMRLHILGKWLSNFAVLSVMVLLVVVAAGVLQLVRGEDMKIEVWPLVAPSLIIAVPTMGLVAALAVLFETIRSLRGGFGNIVYFFLAIPLFVVMGRPTTFIPTNMERSAAEAIPGFSGDLSCCFFIKSQAMDLLGREWTEQETFRFSGMEWDARIFLVRLIYVGVALGIVFLAARIFDRFEGSGRGSSRITLLFESIRRRLHSIIPGRLRRDSTPYGEPETLSELSVSHSQLTPLDSRSTGFRFAGLLVAELRLMLKGLQWWWYLIAVGLIVVSLVMPLEDVQSGLLPAVWLWPVLIWSSMGVREVQHRTDQLVFTASYPLWRQLPVTWLSGLIVTALIGSGVLLRLLIDGNADGAVMWAVGALFIPSLALGLGAWSGSSKVFQIVYMALWFIGPIEGVTRFDFMGLEPEKAVAEAVPIIFLGATLMLLVLAVVGRTRQVRS